MDINLIKNFIDYFIISLLIFMSFLTLFFWIERLLFFKKVDIKSFKSKKELEIKVTNNISIIYSIGANAPYIGLLGTVLSIIITFYLIGINSSIDVKTIMTSLALALKATALGLIVAIPAIFFYNHLQRKIEVLLSKWDIANEKV